MAKIYKYKDYEEYVEWQTKTNKSKITWTFVREDVINKLEIFQQGHVDGHAPRLSGKDLNAYVSAGIRTEHEATSKLEALE